MPLQHLLQFSCFDFGREKYISGLGKSTFNSSDRVEETHLIWLGSRKVSADILGLEVGQILAGWGWAPQDKMLSDFWRGSFLNLPVVEKCNWALHHCLNGERCTPSAETTDVHFLQCLFEQTWCFRHLNPGSFDNNSDCNNYSQEFSSRNRRWGKVFL